MVLTLRPRPSTSERSPPGLHNLAFRDNRAWTLQPDFHHAAVLFSNGLPDLFPILPIVGKCSYVDEGNGRVWWKISSEVTAKGL